jgi:formate-dependent nitrite reductase membrane component NrfD
VAIDGRGRRCDGDRGDRIGAHGLVAQTVSYYDVPLLKRPVWKWYIPAYFFLGGVAGASSTLGLAFPPLRQRCSRLSLAALSAGTVCLVADLGRPSRFANMLRVFRPSSPMSVGSWLLAVYGPAAGASAVLSSSAGAAIAGVAGVPLAGYTGVLVASTAVPAWQDASASMPALFTASGVAGAASLLLLAGNDDEAARVLRHYGIAGLAGELAAAVAVEAEVVDPSAYRTNRLWRAAEALTLGSLLLLLPRRRSRRREVLAGIAGTLGSALVKFAVAQAGHTSTRRLGDSAR